MATGWCRGRSGNWPWWPALVLGTWAVLPPSWQETVATALLHAFGWYSVLLVHVLLQWLCIGIGHLSYGLGQQQWCGWLRAARGPRPWPWEHAEAAHRRRYARLARTALAELALLQLLLAGFQRVLVALSSAEALAAEAWRHEPATRPSPVLLAAQVVAALALQETAFYWTHRLLHATPWLYRFHARHHRFGEALVYGAFYAHPVEVLLNSLLPAAAITQLLGLHVVTQWLWALVHVPITVAVHSGYDALHGRLAVRAHALHHLRGDCHFGSLYPWLCWDCWMRTHAPSPPSSFYPRPFLS